MAETVVYSREFLFIKEMYERGDLGDIQFMKASHPQDMEGWPDYWKKMIPMHYATHVVSPVLGLAPIPITLFLILWILHLLWVGYRSKGWPS